MYSLQPFILYTQLSAAPATSINVIWLEHTRVTEECKKDTTALKHQSMLIAIQFLFFNTVTLMPKKKKKSLRDNQKFNCAKIMKNYKLTRIPITRDHKYPTRNSSVSQKNTTWETRYEDTILLVCVHNSLKCQEPPTQQHSVQAQKT